MSQKHESLPKSPFVEGTTYGETSGNRAYRAPRSTLLNNEKKEIQEKPRIARPEDIAKYVLNKTLAESDVEKMNEEEHLKRLFAFPDKMDDRMYMRTSVTEQSLADARSAYRNTTQEIKKIFNTYSDRGYMTELEAAEALRENYLLRMELGKYLVDQLRLMEFLPSRLSNDSEIKRPNVQGYEEILSSKEYAALLAIAMLDGTYKDSKGDPIVIGTRYDGGEVTNGQHRFAAQEVLGIGNVAKNRVYRTF